MAANVPFIAPQAPFVIVTRKGGFPAATVLEAQRVVRPLIADDKTSITDAAGRKYTAREFLTAVQQADDAQDSASGALPVLPGNLKDWASSTADIDLNGETPPGWSPPSTPSASTSTAAASRSSGRLPSSGARGRPTSDRRPSAGRRRDDAPSFITLLMLVGAALALAAGIAAVVWS